MGPLFSALALAAIGMAAFVPIALFGAFFWSWRFAVGFAVVTVFAGEVGSVFGLMIQTPFWPNELHGLEPLAYLGVGAMFGLGGALGAGYMLVRHSPLRARQRGRRAVERE